MAANTPYAELSEEELRAKLARLQKDYQGFRARDLKLNMARGKPSAAQLALSEPLLSILKADEDCFAEDGTDCRNYGVLEGIPEARALLASILDDAPENTIVFGNSSLTVMYDTLARCLDFGCCGSIPWAYLDTVKWLCPVPGYDRHFSVTEAFGIKMIPVPLVNTTSASGEALVGPDMDLVEHLVAEDPAIKGIWCVPKYANPTGLTYSDAVVRRLASMECAAPDFRIFWDNAYCVHHLSDDPAEQDQLLDIAAACREAGTADRYYKFASTSKITFPGAGISGFAASPANVADTLAHVKNQMIGNDKLTQLRHVRFLHDADGIAAHMRKHAAILRPKFDLVLDALQTNLGGLDIATWTDPHGGYFISFDGLKGTAKRIVGLAADAGVVMTSAGATWPYGNDPADSNIRIAPTMPPLEELACAMEVFVCCVKIASIEKLL